GHAGKARRSRVLRKSGPTALLDRSYAESTVGASAREDYPDRAIAMLFCERGEQNIPRMVEFACVSCHVNAAPGHCQCGICGNQVDMVLLGHHTVMRVHHWKICSVGEGFSRQLLVTRIEMLHNNKSRIAFSRQSG